MRAISVFSVYVLLTATAAAQSVEPAAQRGQVIARTYCMGCHSIDRVSPSPLTIAPPFRNSPQKISSREPRKGTGGRHINGASDYAGVQVRSGSNKRFYLVLENVGVALTT